MFEKATRCKVRFETPKGQLTVEDLWDLPLSSNTGKANLDDLAKILYRDIKANDGMSFVIKEQKPNEIAQMKFDIVKHVIDVKLAENEVAATRRENAEKKQKLMAIIEQKQNEALMGSSLDDLKKMLESL